MDELASFITNRSQRTFSGLSLNTLFYVTVVSHYAHVAHSNSVTTSVRTIDLKVTYAKSIRIHTYTHNAMYFDMINIRTQCT